MKIAYVLTALGSGGTEHWVELATGELVRRGHQVVVIGEHPPQSGLARVERLGAVVLAFEVAPALSEYVRVLRRERVDIVHLHVWERTEELSKLGRLVGAPLVLSYHHVPPRPWRTWAARIARPWRASAVMRHIFSARHVDAHVGCCAASMVGVRGELWPLWQQRVHCIPNSVPLLTQPPLEGMSGPPRFLQVGALVERKNPEATLRAFAELSPSCPDAELTFVGDGLLRTSLEAAALALKRDRRRILFAGQVDDVRPFYDAGNILALPSRNEGLPYSLLEAAAHGLALIATDVGGNREVVVPGRTGILVPAGDQRALCRAMTELALDPELRAKLGRNGRTLVEERLTLGSHIDRLVALYAGLVKKPGLSLPPVVEKRGLATWGATPPEGR